MAAKVCAECNKTKGLVGCHHWEQWPENIDKPHNWTEKIDLTMKVMRKECGLETTVSDLASNCPRYKNFFL